MILHPYDHGDAVVANYYGRGFGSIFARLFSKVAAKTASRAALSAARRVGSKLVKTGIRKAVPIAKKTLTSVVKKGMKKAAPVAKRLVKKGVKRAAEEAQSAIANKVRKVEEMAIKKGVSPELAHMVSTTVEDGAREGIDNLSNLVTEKGDKVVTEIVNKTVPKRKISKSTHRLKSNVGKRKNKKKRISYTIQNLIDSV